MVECSNLQASSLAACVAVALAQAKYDAVIEEAHTAAKANRAQQLSTLWKWPPPPPPQPQPGCPSTDVCHSRGCKHCGCHARSPPCPPAPKPPGPPPGPFSNCPNQVQCPAIETAQMSLFRNNDAVATAKSQAFLEAAFANRSSDWWRMTFGNGTQWAGPPLENAYSVAVFTMFNSRSRWVRAHAVASMSASAEEGMLAFWFRFVQDCGRFYPAEVLGPVLRLHDSENIDAVRHTGCYFGATTLSLFPEYAKEVLPDNTTVAETAKLWESFSYRWLKARAFTGFFDELGSSGYWTRTWPCIWALYMLSDPYSRVQQRAKMFINLAVMEAELSSISGVRAGQKSRDKKATCSTCSKSGGGNPALEHHMYTALTPQLYGDDLNGAVGRLYQAPISTMQLADYEIGNVSILLHRLGAAPETGGTYFVRNRQMGQILGGVANKSTASCAKERCEQTFRPYPCQCEGGGITYHALEPHPRQVHVVSHTPAYALAGVHFSPNDLFVANCQQRGTGLVFSNAEHSTVALPHLTGEKWGLVDRDIMFVQRCGSCNYGGPAQFQIFNATRVWNDGHWWYMESGPKGHARGWAAMRPVWGGANFTSTTAPAGLVAGTVLLQDTWAPMLLLAGSATEYTTAENFSAIVEAAPVVVSNNHKFVTFEWQRHIYNFTPGPSTWKGYWTLPTIDGVPIDIDPPYTYQSPHMNAARSTDTIMTSYRNYSVVYNFTDGHDSITRI